MEINDTKDIKINSEDIETVKTWLRCGYSYSDALEYIRQCIAFSDECVKSDVVPGSKKAEASGFFATDTVEGVSNYYTFLNGLKFAKRGYFDSPAFRQLMYTYLS